MSSLKGLAEKFTVISDKSHLILCQYWVSYKNSTKKKKKDTLVRMGKQGQIKTYCLLLFINHVLIGKRLHSVTYMWSMVTLCYSGRVELLKKGLYGF